MFWVGSHLAFPGLDHIMSEHGGKDGAPGGEDVGVAGEGPVPRHQPHVAVLAGGEHGQEVPGHAALPPLLLLGGGKVSGRDPRAGLVVKCVELYKCPLSSCVECTVLSSCVECTVLSSCVMCTVYTVHLYVK